MNDIIKPAYACMSVDTVVEFMPDHFPDKIGIERSRALYYFPSKGLKSLFIDNVKWQHKRAVLLMFDNMEAAQEICDAANEFFNEDLQVKIITNPNMFETLSAKP